LGADAVISLDQDQKALVSAFRGELAEAGVDVVLDYVWGQPAERVLEAISQKGLRKASPRIRFIQIGEGAGRTISLPAATLRSSGLELLGSGFGSASLDQILVALAEFFQTAAKEPYQFRTRAASLREVEALWNDAEEGTRLVFQP
jgi:NADPH:quinone reductase-like Zn-dependent oxidoreductase